MRQEGVGGERRPRAGAGAAEEAPVGIEPRGGRSVVAPAALREEGPVEDLGPEGDAGGVVGWGEQRGEAFPKVGVPGVCVCVGVGGGPLGEVQAPVGVQPGGGGGPGAVAALREDGAVAPRGAGDGRDEEREDVGDARRVAPPAQTVDEGSPHVDEGPGVGGREDGRSRAALREHAPAARAGPIAAEGAAEQPQQLVADGVAGQGGEQLLRVTGGRGGDQLKPVPRDHREDPGVPAAAGHRVTEEREQLVPDRPVHRAAAAVGNRQTGASERLQNLGPVWRRSDQTGRVRTGEGLNNQIGELGPVRGVERPAAEQGVRSALGKDGRVGEVAEERRELLADGSLRQLREAREWPDRGPRRRQWSEDVGPVRRGEEGVESRSGLREDGGVGEVAEERRELLADGPVRKLRQVTGEGPGEGLQQASLRGQRRQECRQVRRLSRAVQPESRTRLREDGSARVPVEQLRELVEERGAARGRARGRGARGRLWARGSLRGGVGRGAAEEPATPHGVGVEEATETAHDAGAAARLHRLSRLRVMVLHELLQYVKVGEARPRCRRRLSLRVGEGAEGRREGERGGEGEPRAGRRHRRLRRYAGRARKECARDARTSRRYRSSARSETGPCG